MRIINVDITLGDKEGEIFYNGGYIGNIKQNKILKILNEYCVEYKQPEPKTEQEKTRDKFKKNKTNLLKKLLKTNNYCCAKCESKENICIDHIKPIAKGGGNQIENLQFLCRTCNSKKGKKYENSDI